MDESASSTIEYVGLGSLLFMLAAGMVLAAYPPAAEWVAGIVVNLAA